VTRSPSPHFVQNLRFLLWSKGVPTVDWAQELQSAIEPGGENAWGLLLGSKTASESELEKIALRYRADVEDLAYGDLMAAAGTNIVQANLRMLISTLRGGRKKLLAQHLGVHPATISRWLSGTQTPEKKALQELVIYFHLRAGTDLTTEPLFLSPYPVSDTERRTWLLQKVTEIDLASLSELFPALVRLLGGGRR
jgi:transcriptional regulator with XRE-family HTH domain